MTEMDDGAALEAAASDTAPEAAMLEAVEPGPERQAEAAPDPRRRSDAQARIDAVTRARREAERERDYWRERASGGGADRSANREGLPEGLESMGPGDEHRDDGGGKDGGEIDPTALLARIRDEARAELMAEAEAFGQAHAAREAAAAWEGRQASFAQARPDYAQAVLGARWACSETMADAIQDSDAGPALAYHLARHPDEAAAIAALSPLGQVRALGRIEAGLVEGVGNGAAAALAVSHAPAPPPSVRGSGGRFRPAPDTDDFAAFDRAYGAR
jgi:hypothetical protein